MPPDAGCSANVTGYGDFATIQNNTRSKNLMGATTGGTGAYRERVPEQDAATVAALREAGAVILGKTNTHELAFGGTTNNIHYGATRNPWKPDHVPGGSSAPSGPGEASTTCWRSCAVPCT